MQARARIVAETDSTGSTRLVDMRDAAPIGLRWTRDAVYLVSTAQGLVGDDDLELEITVRPGATLHIRSAAATLAYASSGARLSIRASVGSGGTLNWRPEPLIATRYCDLTVNAEITLAGDASLDWTEECLLGRFGEEPGNLNVSISIDRAGRPLLRHQLLVGAASPSWDGPAVLGGARAVGYRIAVGGASRATGSGSDWAVMRLDDDSHVITGLAQDYASLRRAMTEAQLDHRDEPRTLSAAGKLQ